MELVKGIPFYFSATRFLVGNVAVDLLCFRISNVVKKLLFVVLGIRACAELHQRAIRHMIEEFDWNFTCSLFPFFISIIDQKINKRNLLHFALFIINLVKEENSRAAEGCSLDQSPKGDKKIIWDPKPKSRLISILVASALAGIYIKLFKR